MLLLFSHLYLIYDNIVGYEVDWSRGYLGIGIRDFLTQSKLLKWYHSIVRLGRQVALGLQP